METKDPKDKLWPKLRKPRKATPKSLKNAAHYHLQRFSSSSENLRRVLGRRVERSARAIHAKLREKGLRAEVIDAAIEALAKNHAEPESAAAYDRRRRLGRYRPVEARAERRKQDLGAMARPGFDYDLSLRVIDAEDIDALEEDASLNCRPRRPSPPGFYRGSAWHPWR